MHARIESSGPSVNRQSASAPPRAASGSGDEIREGEIRVDLDLRHGGHLRGACIAWRCEGAAHGPLIVALGGISADRHVVSRDGRAGWWSKLVGPGRGIDTDRVRVLSFDYVGASGDSCGPADSEQFPAIDTADQAAVIAALLDELGIERADIVLGASYGAMVALAFGARFPGRARHLLVISGAHKPHPLSTAWRALQRKIVRYGQRAGAAREALALARGLAMTTYRTAEEFAERFDAAPALTAEGFRFPVENYLDERGTDFSTHANAAGFLCLSESIDLHRLDPAEVRVPATLVAVAQDRLVPLEQMRELASDFGARCRLLQLHSHSGHDAFLTEHKRLASLCRTILRELT